MNTHLLFPAILSMTLMSGCGGDDDTGSDAGPDARGAGTDQAGGVVGNVRGVVARKKGQVQYCYELALKEDADVSGRLVASIEIEAGQVTSVIVSENQTGSLMIEDCVTDKIRGWRFAPEVTESVYLPFALSAS